jgi:phosphoenolpyruvate synthase/pyruvate phosphate dikinase
MKILVMLLLTIVGRELGLAAVGTEHGTESLQGGQALTISRAEGDVGFVYEGERPTDVEKMNLKNLQRPQTRSCYTTSRQTNMPTWRPE